MAADQPSFAEAVEQLRSFLIAQDWPTEIAWLRAAAVTTRDQLVVVNPNRLLELQAASLAYCAGMSRGLGVLLAGLAHDASRSYCYVWTPESEADAEASMISAGLKLSLVTQPRPVLLATGLRFWLLRCLGPPRHILRELLA